MRSAFLADRSALVRFGHPKVARRLKPLLEEGLIATCAIIDLEVLFSARSLADYEAVREESAALDDVPITPSILRRSIDVQHQLARKGRHRVPIPALIIAATAHAHDVPLLTKDAEGFRALTGAIELRLV